jgi:hypothetical protein
MLLCNVLYNNKYFFISQLLFSNSVLFRALHISVSFDHLQAVYKKV